MSRKKIEYSRKKSSHPIISGSIALPHSPSSSLAAYPQSGDGEQLTDNANALRQPSHCQPGSCQQPLRSTGTYALTDTQLPNGQLCQAHFSRTEQLSLSSRTLPCNQTISHSPYCHHAHNFSGAGYQFTPVSFIQSSASMSSQSSACHFPFYNYRLPSRPQHYPSHDAVLSQPSSPSKIETLIAQAKERFPQVLKEYMASRETEPGLVNTSSSSQIVLLVYRLPRNLNEQDVKDMFSICTHHEPSPKNKMPCPQVLYLRKNGVPNLIYCCSSACADIQVKLWDRKAHFKGKTLRVIPKSSKTSSSTTSTPTTGFSSSHSVTTSSFGAMGPPLPVAPSISSMDPAGNRATHPTPSHSKRRQQKIGPRSRGRPPKNPVASTASSSSPYASYSSHYSDSYSNPNTSDQSPGE